MKWKWDNLTKMVLALVEAGHARLATFLVCVVVLAPIVLTIVLAVIKLGG